MSFVWRGKYSVLSDEAYHIVGVDYGSQLAGTTVLVTVLDGTLVWQQSQRKQKADNFIHDQLARRSGARIFLDAPLSLPGVYTHISGYNDYFYRRADRTLRAMSPLFLGGLTARAMQLAARLRAGGHQVFETYPVALARIWSLAELGYRGKQTTPDTILHALQSQLPFPLMETPANWHQVDALLAWLSGYRMLHGVAQQYGDTAEGVIVV